MSALPPVTTTPQVPQTNLPQANPGTTAVLPANPPANKPDTLAPQKQEKSSWTKCLEAIYKWPCIGPIIARIFGYVPETQIDSTFTVNQPAQQSEQAIEDKAKSDVLSPFLKPDPNFNMAKVKASFATLNVRAKLEVLERLQAIPLCIHVNLLELFNMLSTATEPNSPLVKLYGYIEGKRPGGEMHSGKEILEADSRCKMVQDAVQAYIKDEKVKADAERRKMILDVFKKPEYPLGDARAQAIKQFKSIESDLTKLQTLKKLSELGTITDTCVTEFALALPGPQPQPEPSIPAAQVTQEVQPQVAVPAADQSGQGAQVTKGVEIVVEEPIASAAPVAAQAVPTLQERFYAKVKVELLEGEERYKLAYERVQRFVADEQAKGTNIPLKMKSPVVYDNLGDYFAARSKNLLIRQVVLEKLEELIQEEQLAAV